MGDRPMQQVSLLSMEEPNTENETAGRKKARKKANGYEPPNLGKIIGQNIL